MRRIITALAAGVLIAATPTQSHAQAPAPITTTGTLTATSAITATLTPAQKQQQVYAAIYSTAASVKIAQVVLEETAVARANNVDNLKLLAGVLAIGESISQTRAALAKPAPAPELSKEWAALKAQNDALTDLARRWIADKSITAKDVLAEMPAIAKRIDTTNAQITTLIAKRIPRANASQLQRDYDAQISKFRTEIQALLR